MVVRVMSPSRMDVANTPATSSAEEEPLMLLLAALTLSPTLELLPQIKVEFSDIIFGAFYKETDLKEIWRERKMKRKRLFVLL
jgi:hypothetical protein